MGKVKADLDNKQPFQEPDFGIDGVVAHLNQLKNETEAIFNAPPPKKEEPKPEEKPAEAKAEGEQPAPENGADKPAEGNAEAGKEDAEMKNEQ